MQQMQPALRTYLTKLREDAYIDIKPGFIDSGASPRQTKPVFSAYAPPAPKKKKAEKQRFDRGGRFSAVSKTPTAPGATPAVATPSAATPSVATSAAPSTASPEGTVPSPGAPTDKAAAPAQPSTTTASSKAPVPSKPKKIKREKVKLPARSHKGRYNDQASLRGMKFVEERY